MGHLNLLLDTCTFVWLCGLPNRLSPRTRAALRTGTLHLSHVTEIEVSSKWLARKLELPVPPRAWFQSQLVTWPVRLLPVTEDDIFTASELPALHRDPFDRLLVAQALNHRLTLVTPDEIIHQYPVPFLW